MKMGYARPPVNFLTIVTALATVLSKGAGCIGKQLAIVSLNTAGITSSGITIIYIVSTGMVLNLSSPNAAGVSSGVSTMIYIPNTVRVLIDLGSPVVMGFSSDASKMIYIPSTITVSSAEEVEVSLQLEPKEAGWIASSDARFGLQC